MKIALCNIVKDDTELDSLKKMVSSFKEYVDGIFITANGKNVSGIESFCKENGFNYSYLPWNKNFSIQRNFNFSQVTDDYDYIFWADTDDELVGGEYLRKLATLSKQQDYDTIFLKYWYGCRFDGEPSYKNLVDIELHHYRERLIKPKTIEWKKRIHETPVPIEGGKYKYTRVNHTISNPDPVFPIAILHRGADRDLSKKSLIDRQKRNQEILELELEDERRDGDADPRTMLYLLKIYSESYDPEILQKGIFLGEEYLKKSGWDEERGVCLMEMAKCFGKRGSDDAALKLLLQSVGEWPKNPLLHLMISEAYYNLGMNDKFKYWLKSGLKMDFDETSASMQNILQMKLLSSQLLLRLYYVVDKDPDKALEAAKTLYKIEPTKETLETYKQLKKTKDLNDACRYVDKLVEFYEENNIDDAIYPFISSLPKEIKRFPFAQKLENKFSPPKKWAENEICYFANFGGKHFEKWDGGSLESGVGGSETAVIELAKNWVNMGYKVTVYGDPVREGEYDGVSYKPYYKFNHRDHFNIFIQWRSNGLQHKIKCKQFLVDLHDVYSYTDYIDVSGVDKVMVKSEYHRNIAKQTPDEKFCIISNGI